MEFYVYNGVLDSVLIGESATEKYKVNINSLKPSNLTNDFGKELFSGKTIQGYRFTNIPVHYNTNIYLTNDWFKSIKGLATEIKHDTSKLHELPGNTIKHCEINKNSMIISNDQTRIVIVNDKIVTNLESSHFGYEIKHIESACYFLNSEQTGRGQEHSIRITMEAPEIPGWEGKNQMLTIRWKETL